MEIALNDAVGVTIRRRGNEHTLFSQLPTDIVHFIFGIALDVAMVHDPHFPLHKLRDHRHQLFRMRQVSAAWNDFLLSSPRYWQVINITSPPEMITSILERSGNAPLCVYCWGGWPQAPPINLVPEVLRYCARIRTLRADSANAYHLYRALLQDQMPTLQTLELTRSPDPIGGPTMHLGNLPSISHLNATRWQPPSDAPWLEGLKELILSGTSELNMELIRVLSACVNLKRLTILNKAGGVAGELPGAVLQIALPRLQHVHIEFESKDSAVRLVRKLIFPQCFQSILFTERSPYTGPYVVDYRRFMSQEESCTWESPESARIFMSSGQLEYKSYSHEIRFKALSAHRAFHDLVQEIQSLSNEPSLRVTIKASSPQIWTFFESFGNQNIQTIIGYFTATRSTDARDLLKAIGARPTNLTDLDGPMAGWSFAPLRSICIHDTCVELFDLTRRAKEYLHKDLKPSLEEIVFVHCSFRGMELDQAAESLAVIGIALKGVECFGSH